MSPAAADFSYPISSQSHPISQNPNPINLSSNGACGFQSTSLNFADTVSNGGLSFDFSNNKGSRCLGQSKPPRIKHQGKKVRGKIGNPESNDFSNVLRTSVDSSLGNEANFIPNSTSDYLCGRSLGKKAGAGDSVQFGTLGKVGSVFCAEGTSLGSNFGKENEGSSLGTNKSSSKSSFSDRSESFVFGARNDSSQLNFDIGGMVFGVEKSSSMPSSNHKNYSFVFVADKISSEASLSSNDVGSMYKEGKGASLFDTNTNYSTSNSRSKNGDFVCGSSESYSSNASNMRCGKPSPTMGHPLTQQSNTFNSVRFVFGASNDRLASDTRFEQKGCNNGSSLQSGNNDIGLASANSKTKVKLDATEFFERDGHSSFATSVGTEWNPGARKDHSGFCFGATKNDSLSRRGKIRTGRRKGKPNFVSQGEEGTPAGNDFQKADLNGTYEFGNSTEEKPSSINSSDLRKGKNNLDERKSETGSASVYPSDAMESRFKFVTGSSSSPGNAFYKVPLSKLLDEMKGLKVDSSEGINGNDKANVFGTNSRFSADNMFSFESNEQAPVSGKKNQTLNPTEKTSIRNELQEDQPNCVNYMNKTSQTSVFSSSASSYVEQKGLDFETSPAIKIEKLGNFCFDNTAARVDASPQDLKYEKFSFTPNLFPGSGENLKFCANSYMRDKRLKKKGKLRQRVQAKHLNEQDQISKEGSSLKTSKSPGCYSPMDFSPYQEAPKNVPGDFGASMATEKKEEDCSAGRQQPGNNEHDKREQDDINSKVHQESNSKPSYQNGLSAIRRQYRKKYKPKDGNCSSGKTYQKSDVLFSSAQFSSNASNPFRVGEPQLRNGVASSPHSKAEGKCAKQHSCEDVMNGECDQWRIRGNQAYKNGDLSKAEEFYTNGINSVREKNVPGFYSDTLLLCYTNRAATRMSLRRLREALEDCKFAATLDPKFLKAKLRAANCYLLLGEFQEAIQYYNYCLESGNAVHLDRKIVIEAAEGIQKAQKASEYMHQSANLLQQTTSDAASCALVNIAKGLSISCYSERFFEMKGEAFFLLRRYSEVIELCEQTLLIAEKNFSAIQLANDSDIECKKSGMIWRWRLKVKCQFHLGRLEAALVLIERQQNSASVSDWSSSTSQDSLIPLAAIIRELLHLKKAGNEAFQSEKHSEAIEHYTAAISRSLDSRPFAAVCFCNRAAAHQALGLVADAIADCSVAIALDGDYVKAVSRRATLHEMIRDYKQAVIDIQKLIALLENQSQKSAQQSGKPEGSSGTDARELRQAQRRLSLMEEKAKKESPMDFYLILGIKASDSEAEIKKAYRKAALKHHPDKAGQYLARADGGDDGRSLKDIAEKVHEDADRLFKLIGEAYAVLSDADKRAKYNMEEEIRNSSSNGQSKSDTGRSYDHHSSPYDKEDWSGRQPNFSGSTYERSRNSRRHWQEWRSSYAANSHARW